MDERMRLSGYGGRLLVRKISDTRWHYTVCHVHVTARTKSNDAVLPVMSTSDKILGI